MSSPEIVHYVPENQNKNLKIKKNLLVKVGRKLQKMKLEKTTF